MEIVSPKYRSPPPKPPRRRHSDQLRVFSTGTYHSDNKKHTESEINSRTGLSRTEDSEIAYTSLPTNWISTFSSESRLESSTKSFESALSNFPDPSCNIHQLSSNYGAQTSYVCNEFPSVKTVEMESNLGETLLMCISDKNNQYCKDNFNDSAFPSKYNIRTAPQMLGCTLEKKFSQDDVRDKKNVLNQLEYFNKNRNTEPLLSCIDNSVLKNKSEETINLTLTFHKNQMEKSSSSDVEFGLKEKEHLHEEIKILKEINDKLWQHVCTMQERLEKTNSNEDLTEESVSELLSSLYYLQKAKDSVMEDRLKTVLMERDSSVQELEEVIQVISRNFEDDCKESTTDQEFKELLKEIDEAYNPAQLLNQQRLLLTYLYQSKKLNQDNIAQELKITATERDKLRDKVTSLEEELKSLKLSNEIRHFDNIHWENSLLNILCKVLHQRDDASIKTNNSAGIENSNRCSKIENITSDEHVAKDKNLPNAEHLNHKDIKKIFSCQYDLLSSPPFEENAVANHKLAILIRTLDMEVEKRASAENLCLRLERLVSVLQKKVNGQNVGVQV